MPTASVSYIASNLDRLQTVRGLSDARLAEWLGTDRRKIWQWRRGKSMPLSSDSERLCVALDCSMDELTKPLYASNLIRLMQGRGLDSTALAEATGIPVARLNRLLNGGNKPGEADLNRLAASLICDIAAITGWQRVLPLQKWAKREDIPLVRAKDLVELGLLPEAIPTAFDVLVPVTVTAPADSKRLVLMTKRRPRWGITGWDGLGTRLDTIMLREHISNDTLATGMQVNLLTVWFWRIGRRVPEESKLEKIAEICRCSVEELVGVTKAAA